ncbi:MAG: hypothetical protein ACLSCR_03370 [Akkermansia sp.]
MPPKAIRSNASFTPRTCSRIHAAAQAGESLRMGRRSGRTRTRRSRPHRTSCPQAEETRLPFSGRSNSMVDLTIASHP